MDLETLDIKIKKELLTTLPIFLLSVAAPISAWFGLFQYDEDGATWFQRSGSIMVLFAVWVEFKLFNIANLANPISENGTTFDDMRKGDTLKSKYNKRLKTRKYIAAVLAITGTVIWGYGDILRQLSC